MARGQKTKQKELTPEERMQSALVPREEWPYELPEGWKWVTLGRLTDVIGGGTPSTRHPEYYEGGTIPWLSPADLSGYSEMYISKGQKNITQDGLDNSSARLLPKETVCLSSRAPIGYVVIAQNPLCTNQGFKSFTPSEYIYPEFLYWYLKANKPMLESMASGTTFLELSGKKAGQIMMPLPSVEIQKSISSFVDREFNRLDEAKDQIQSVLDSSEERKQSILHKAFTGELTEKWRKNNETVYQKSDYYDKLREEVASIKKKKIKKVNNPFSTEIRAYIPKKWEMCELDAVSRQITDGEHSTPRRVDAYIGYYLLSARNVRDDSIQLDDVDYIDAEEYGRISARCNPGRGDVLISCSGSVGRVCVIEDDNKYCMVRSAAMISPVMCNPRFIMYMLQSPELQKEIKELSKQTAQANLFLGAIAALLIPLPIIEEQDEVVRILDSYFLKNNQIVDVNEQINDQIDVAKKSILSKAFRGELHL